MLEKALTPTRRDILQALLPEPKTLSELESLTEKRKPTLLKHLRFLEDSGIVRKEVVTTEVGRETRYSLRPYTLLVHIDPKKGAFLKFETPDDVDLSFPLAEQVPQAEFRGDVKTYLRSFARACQGWRRKPSVVLFGSVARGEGTWKSDIDALVILPSEGGARKGRTRPPRRAEETLRKGLAKAADKAKHLLKPHFVGVEEFLAGDEGVLREAKAEGILVWGELTVGREIWRQLKRYRTITI